MVMKSGFHGTNGGAEMHIPTIEDDFDYNFKKVIDMMRDDFPDLSNLSSDDFQEAVWYDKEMCVYFTQKMFERAYEYGGDRMFGDENEEV